MIEYTKQPNERIEVYTPLGIRFWDPVSDKQIIDDLRVTARPAIKSGPVIDSFRTASGIYAFRGLPGLHDIEYPREGLSPNVSPPEQKRFIIEVEDMRRQFLSTVFTVYLPLPYDGIYPNAAFGSPSEESPPGFFLFSAPTRSVSPGLAAIRGLLVERLSGAHAAYAVLEVRIEGRTWYGVADDRGCITLLFPYPVINGMLLASPPFSPELKSWQMAMRVRYAPDSLVFPYGSRFPDLRTIWNQSPGVLYADSGAPGVSELSSELIFGQEFILRTEGLSESILWIDIGT